MKVRQITNQTWNLPLLWWCNWWAFNVFWFVLLFRFLSSKLHPLSATKSTTWETQVSNLLSRYLQPQKEKQLKIFPTSRDIISVTLRKKAFRVFLLILFVLFILCLWFFLYLYFLLLVARINKALLLLLLSLAQIIFLRNLSTLLCLY